MTDERRAATQGGDEPVPGGQDEPVPDGQDEPVPDGQDDEIAPSDDASVSESPPRGGRDVGDRLEALLSEHREDPPEEEQTGEEPFDPFAPRPDSDADAAADAGDEGLPDAPLFALLRTLADEITPQRIDRVWIFPPRRIETGETAVVVVAAFTEAGTDRRRVYAAHYTALDDADEHRLAVDEFGTAPADRVGRLVEEVVERIKEGPTGAPRSVRIEGRERQWDETLHELAEAYLEERQRDRRIRS